VSHPHDPVAICTALNIVLDFVYPPIPVRNHDWQAHVDGFEEDGSIGEGRTKHICAWDALWNYEGYKYE
jgi:hypothetical protein